MRATRKSQTSKRENWRSTKGAAGDDSGENLKDPTGFALLGDSNNAAVTMTESSGKLEKFIQYVRAPNGNVPENPRTAVFTSPPGTIVKWNQSLGIGSRNPSGDHFHGRRLMLFVCHGVLCKTEDGLDYVERSPMISNYHYREWFDMKSKAGDTAHADLNDLLTEFYYKLISAYGQVAQAVIDEKKVQMNLTNQVRTETFNELKQDGITKKDPEFEQKKRDLMVHKFIENSNLCHNYGVDEDEVRDALYTAAWYDVWHPDPADKDAIDPSSLTEEGLNAEAKKLYERRLAGIEKKYAAKYATEIAESEAMKEDADFGDQPVLTPFSMFCRDLFIIRYTRKAFSMDYSRGVQGVLDKFNTLNSHLQKEYESVFEQKESELLGDERFSHLSPWQRRKLAKNRTDYWVLQELKKNGAIFRPFEWVKHGVQTNDSRVNRDSVVIRCLESNENGNNEHEFFKAFPGLGNGMLVRLKWKLSPYSTKERFGIRADAFNYVYVIDGARRRNTYGRSVDNLGAYGGAENVVEHTEVGSGDESSRKRDRTDSGGDGDGKRQRATNGDAITVEGGDNAFGSTSVDGAADDDDDEDNVFDDDDDDDDDEDDVFEDDD